MGTCKFVYGRRVWVKRVASLCGVFLILPLAGCSSQSERFDFSDTRGSYGATGSVPVPPEPVYGYGSGKNSGYTYSTPKYDGYDGGNRDGSYSRAPFASSAPDSSYRTTSVERSGLAPASGNSVRRYDRYAANTTSGTVSDANMGGSYAMMPVEATSGRASGASGQRMAYDDYRANNRNAYDGRYDNGRRSDGDLKDRGYANSGRYDDGRDARGYRQEDARDDYMVQQGDTLYGIAQRFHLTTDQLMALNDLRTSDLVPGQRLRVAGYAYTGTNRPDAQSWTPPANRNGYDNYGNAPRNDYQNDNRGGYRNDYANAPRNDYRGGYQGDARNANDDGRGATYPKTRNTNNGSNRDSNGYAQDNYGGYNGYNGYNGYDNQRRDPAPRRDGGYAERDVASTAGNDARLPQEHGREIAGSRGGRRDAVRYTVKRGDTVFDIARRNGISHRELADYNDMPLSAKLVPGQSLFIPRGKGYDWSTDRLPPDEGRDDRWGAKQPQSQGGNARYADNGAPANARAERTASSKPVRTAVAGGEARTSARAELPAGPGSRSAVASNEPVQIVSGKREESSSPAAPAEGTKVAPRECESLLANPAPRSAKNFREPVQGMVTTKFGPKEDGSFSDGVDFAVPKGTPVKAAENGVVAYAGDELSGFGNLVLIRHADGYVTAYANNEELTVGRCEVVKRGQVIGKAGTTGNATKPQLHFELRKDSKPVDPETYFSRS